MCRIPELVPLAQQGELVLGLEQHRVGAAAGERERDRASHDAAPDDRGVVHGSARRRSRAYARASSTSAAITRDSPSASGCHWTPSAKRRSGSSSASGSSSSVDQPLTASPSPISPTPWWWCESVAVLLLAGGARGERACGEAHGVVVALERAERCGGGPGGRGARAGPARACRRARRSSPACRGRCRGTACRAPSRAWPARARSGRARAGSRRSRGAGPRRR